MTLSEYSTEELERLTTLTFQTMKGGEYVDVGAIVLRGHNGSLVTADGHIGGLGRFLNMATANRRVVSFTDATELDPPQAEMLAELARRKAPPLRFRKGDVVVYDDNFLVNRGHLATVTTCREDDMDVQWDQRLPYGNEDGKMWSTRHRFRLATPADIAAYEARIPKAPVFKVGELVRVLTGSAHVTAIKRVEPDYFGMATGYTVSEGWIYRREDLRPATDAEVAAYHRTHCQPNVAPPAPISNATHAGQWVKWMGWRCKVLRLTDLLFMPACGLLAVVDEDGYVAHIKPNEADLIDPPTWPK